MTKDAKACRRCGGQMMPGIAMAQTLRSGSPDFVGGEVVTVSPGGPGKLVQCQKCAACGHSVTIDGVGAWGRDDLMAIAAVRYCLGRMTYITSDCSEWLVQQWPHIKPSARAVIQRDIEEAFVRDDEAREAGDSYKPLGWDCDREQWERVRKLWQAP